MKKCGVKNSNEQIKRIVEIMKGRPVSIQVSKVEAETIYAEAKQFSKLGDNVVIKVPVVSATGESTLPIIHKLAQEGYQINATVCLKATQAIMAAMAGARYVSLFFGRIRDHDGDPMQQISLVREWLDQSGLDTEIIVASIRSVDAVCESLIGRPHICTITPKVLNECIDHVMSRKTVLEFESAAAEILK